MTEPRPAPEWWLSRPEPAEEWLRSLEGVEVAEIGRSAGDRPIIAASFGPKEALEGRTSESLASALSGGASAAFYGEGERERQSLVVVGNAHGIEFEGTVAALNMMNALVTGEDLRGTPWPEMHAAGQQLRVTVIPHLNIDGRMRFNDVAHFLDADVETYRRICQGDWKSGEKIQWPTSKLTFPIPVDEVDPLGGYFNDNGVNLVYDTGLGADPQPETRALLAFCRQERPDCVLCSHTDRGSLVQPPDSFVPSHYRQRQLQIGAAVSRRAQRQGVVRRHEVAQRQRSYAGEVLYQTDLIYHACGALPLLVEFPVGYTNFPYTFDEVLDIGLGVYEEVTAFGVANRFRPKEPK